MPPKKPEAKGVKDSDLFAYLAGILAVFLIISGIITAVFNYLGNFGVGTPQTLGSSISEYFLSHVWPVWEFVALIFSVAAIVGIVYNVRKLGGINREETKIYNPPLLASSEVEREPVLQPKNDKWEKVIKYSNSNNPSDWRQAIIEADVMFEDLMRTLGYTGESVGEMLKSVDKSDFLTLDDAWEAHKVRNAIAHSGSEFQLTERETRRVISLFEKVFKEFQVI